MAREHTTRRSKILDALVIELNAIDGTGHFKSNLEGNIEPRMKFWDEVDSYPAVHMSAGTETREYYGGGNKWRYLTLTLRAYVNDDDPITELEAVLEDIETIIDSSSSLTYEEDIGAAKAIAQISIISISTDEGVLAPLGVGEMVIEVQY